MNAFKMYSTKLALGLALISVVGTLPACGPKGTKLQSFSDEQLATDPVANFQLGVQKLENPDKNGVVDYEGAYRAFNSAAELGNSPKAHFNAAWCAEVLNQPDKAEKHYGKAFEADPSYKAAMYSYARVLTDNGSGPQGAEVLRRFIASHPDDLEARNELVNALGSSGMYDEAVSEAREVLLRAPDNAQVYRNLSALYFAQGNYSMSQLSNERALALEEGDGGTYNNMAVTYLVMGEEGAAIEELQTAVKLDPNNFEANTNLGYIALSSGDYGLAHRTLLKAVEVRPASIVAKMGLAIASRGMKDYDKAGTLYDEIIDADPKNQFAYFNAATLHEKYTKDYDKALEYLQSFVEANSVGPDHEVFSRMERVKASKAEEEARKAEEDRKRREEEERQRRNEELLAGLGAKVAAFQAKLDNNAECLGPIVDEGAMLVEQANMVIETKDTGMAPDIQQMLEEYYSPMVDEALAACGGAAPAPEEAEEEEAAPAE